MTVTTAIILALVLTNTGLLLALFFRERFRQARRRAALKARKRKALNYSDRFPPFAVVE